MALEKIREQINVNGKTKEERMRILRKSRV